MRRDEKQLQEAIAKLLAYNRVTFIRSRMDQRTSNNLGTPDFLFAINGQAIGWEAKMPGKKCSPIQLRMHERLRSNGWLISVITSLDAAIEELNMLAKPHQYILQKLGITAFTSPQQ